MIPRVSCQRDQGGSQTLVGPENQEMVTAHKKMLGCRAKWMSMGAATSPVTPETGQPMATQHAPSPWSMSQEVAENSDQRAERRNGVKRDGV